MAHRAGPPKYEVADAAAFMRHLMEDLEPSEYRRLFEQEAKPHPDDWQCYGCRRVFRATFAGDDLPAGVKTAVDADGTTRKIVGELCRECMGKAQVLGTTGSNGRTV